MIKKIIFVILAIGCIALFFKSCSSEEYSKKIDSATLCDALTSEISVPEGEFSKYSDEDIRFFFANPQLYDNICISYSTDTTDVSEVGVISAKDEESAKKLLEEAKLYIKDAQEQKRDFLRNYAPAELEKINSAEAQRFGKYVIFTISEPSEADAVFEKAKNKLK